VTLLAILVALVLPAAAAAQLAPNTRPTGGKVVAGTAAISATSTDTVISQTSERAAITWQSFDVGSHQSVTFQQPSSSAIALVRVLGPNPSEIAGRITSNGQVVIVNASGTAIAQGAILNDQSLVISSANVSTLNFMSGNLVFDQPGKPNASVKVQGAITVHQAGLAALVAPLVTGGGTIAAMLGRVDLLAARTETVDLTGGGLTAVQPTSSVQQAPIGANGKPATALVSLTGHVTAAGGSVRVAGAAADGIVKNVVSIGGHALAQHGAIAVAATGGDALLSGGLGTQGGPGLAGGNIAVNATGSVHLTATARVNASGPIGGGVIAVGTTIARASGGPGTVSVTTARNTVVDSGAQLHADAVREGAGGKVVLLSTAITNFAGAITAKGGKHGGNGGTVEVSGATLAFTGSVDVSAPMGTLGTFLLDPKVFL
jgi:filamentous hemagglutinin family protein